MINASPSEAPSTEPGTASVHLFLASDGVVQWAEEGAARWFHNEGSSLVGAASASLRLSDALTLAEAVSTATAAGAPVTAAGRVRVAVRNGIGSGRMVQLSPVPPAKPTALSRAESPADSNANDADASAAGKPTDAPSDCAVSSNSSDDASSASPGVRAVLNSLPEHVAVLDAEGTIVHVNDSWTAFAENNGAPAAPSVQPGNNYLSHCRVPSGPDSAFGRQAREGIQAVLSREQVDFEMDYPCDAPSEKRWFRMRVVPLRRPEGGAIVAHLNVTAEKRDQKRLKMFETAIECAGDSILITEAEPIDGPGPRIIYANEAFTEHTGYSEADVLGKTPRILQGPDTDRAPLDRIRQSLEQWESCREVVLNYTKEGTPFWNEIYIAPVDNEAGWYTHWVSVQRDVTEQRQMLKQLDEQKAQLEAVIDTAMDAILTVDADRRIVLFNRAAERIFGCDATQAVGRPLDRLIAPSHRAEDLDRLFGAVPCDKGAGEVCRVTLQRDDETAFPAEGSRATVEVDGTVFHTLILRDVTEREQYEQSLVKAKEEAEQASRLKSAMLANMSHEIRTPLTSVIGFSEILADALQGQYGEFAERVMQSSRRLMQTLDSVLQLSKLEAGLARLETHRFDLCSEVTDAVEMLQPRADEHEVDLSVQTPTDRLLGRGDPAAINRILMNLIGNAIKFTPSGGSIAVSVTRDDALVCIVVQDTGIGINPAFLPKIFDAFQQESHGLSRSHEGSGLGLTIVYRLVDVLNGTITIDSEKGEGTRVEVRFPWRG